MEKRVLIFDTECSMLPKFKPKEVLQFGAIETDTSLNSLKTISEYFSATKDIDMESFCIHKIDAKIAEELTNYDFLEVFVKTTDTFKEDNTLYIIHNANFDIGAVNSELEEAGEDVIDFGPRVRTFEEAKAIEGPCHLDTVNYFRDTIKLTDKGGLEAGMAQHFSNTEVFVDALNKFAKRDGAKLHRTDSHNALYDAFCVYVLLAFARKQGKLI